MKKEYYEKYTKEEMIDVVRNTGYLIVNTSNKEYFGISKDDLVDFIVLEAERCHHDVNMIIYAPYCEYPLVKTIGYFLDKIRPLLREEIIDRLVGLQTYEIRPRKVKIFDIEMFRTIIGKELTEEENSKIMYDKFYKKYFEDSKEYDPLWK